MPYKTEGFTNFVLASEWLTAQELEGYTLVMQTPGANGVVYTVHKDADSRVSSSNEPEYALQFKVGDAVVYTSGVPRVARNAVVVAIDYYDNALPYQVAIIGGGRSYAEWAYPDELSPIKD